MMTKKIRITESQYNNLRKALIIEGDYHVILNNILEDLDKNYERVTAIVNDYNDYREEPRFKVKVDDSVTSAKQMLEYMKIKYHGVCGEDFLKQVIDDWYHNNINDGSLSKNITLK